MDTEKEIDSLRGRVHDISSSAHSMMLELRTHVVGCEAMSKNNQASLARIEAGLMLVNAAYLKFVVIVLGAMGATLLAIFAAWLATGGGKH